MEWRDISFSEKECVVFCSLTVADVQKKRLHGRKDKTFLLHHSSDKHKEDVEDRFPEM